MLVVADAQNVLGMFHAKGERTGQERDSFAMLSSSWLFVDSHTQHVACPALLVAVRVLVQPASSFVHFILFLEPGRILCPPLLTRALTHSSAAAFVCNVCLYNARFRLYI